jgi:predicted NAD-dependent protein-ADP-ribosyltransferase YbiA (DUF1768 family)
MEIKDKLYFCHKSKDAKVGNGIHESIQNPNLYTQLSIIKDWRKILDNTFEYPFIYKGKTWKTVEHSLQGAKFLFASDRENITSTQMSNWFCLESGHNLGRVDGLTVKSQGNILLKKSELSEWKKEEEKILYEILLAKFTQSKNAKKTLLATNDAELWLISGSKHIRQIIMEQVRNSIKNIN